MHCTTDRAALGSITFHGESADRANIHLGHFCVLMRSYGLDCLSIKLRVDLFGFQGAHAFDIGRFERTSLIERLPSSSARGTISVGVRAATFAASLLDVHRARCNLQEVHVCTN